MAGERFVVAAAAPLLEALAAHFPTWSRNTLRQRLRLGCVRVDGDVVARGDQPVVAGAVVEVFAKGEGEVAGHDARDLPVLHDGDDLLAIDKPAGLLSVASDDERERTALAQMRARLQARDRDAELLPVHRLDRETSGVLLFARSRAIRDAVQAAWGEVERVYVAIVAGRLDPPTGTIDAPLWEDRNLRVHAGRHPDACDAVTHYRTLRADRHRSEVELTLATGRKHQIRVHLASRGCPIVGDDRYGQRDARLFLHSQRLVLPHPRDGRPIELVAAVPPEFRRALGAR